MTPVSQILPQPRQASGPHLPGEPGQANSGSRCVCPALPTVPVTHTGPSSLGGREAGGKRGSISP